MTTSEHAVGSGIEPAAAEVTVPGPGSLHWRYAGDHGIYVMLVRAGLLQLMLPDLGRGVQDHSDFFSEPWERVLRSVPQIQGVTFDWPNGTRTARMIREYHTGIKGAQPDGRRYHALAPETYYWAHATIFDAALQFTDTFLGALSEKDKETFYAESCQVFRGYGVSDRIMPPDYRSFREYFDQVCAEQLELTPTAKALVQMGEEPPERFPLLPQPLYRLLRKPSGKVLWWVAVGTLPPVIRDRIGASWSPRDERRYQRMCRSIGRVWPLLPSAVRYTPRARAGFRRAGVGPAGC
ncbi:uncharacterized protein (DUF2236 family) [Tamaricihabitans halophyticus]|uniref:Uncharacterized protein (DUF2236 family) n=1 Tax=Tamaricihabitans halophyticus TaxID=1262583 RepID=A0A4R2QWJ3_9PSEU|nr:oxygenase MpaB family protein [Tamaricihabitans halophyticus]TCP53644.1 uncharacterized protein (DUF2236 family) [Tamaricihabitans halophyticus]